jgi:hypothetical protein
MVVGSFENIPENYFNRIHYFRMGVVLKGPWTKNCE